MKRSWSAVGVAIAMLAAAGCTSISTGETAPTSAEPASTDLSNANPGDCITVDMTVSPEKIVLLTDLARTFNDQRNTVDGTCVFVRPQKKSSGAAASLLADGWDDTDRQRPAAGDLVAGVERLGQHRQPAARRPGPAADRPGQQAVHADAARDRHAQADGRRARLPEHADRVQRHRSRWPRTRRAGPRSAIPEWGPFRLGKTNPNFSTSGLNFTLAEYYAATGKTKGLTNEDLERRRRRAVRHRRRDRPSSTTATRRSRSSTTGTAPTPGARRSTYTSAVAVEEKSVIDYNSGNPDGDARRRARSRGRRRCRSWPSTRRKARSSPTTRSSSSTRRG